MEITAEKFQSLKELSEIQVAVSASLAEFQKLQVTTDAYLVEREKEATKRVDAALLASREALVEADKNKDAVASLLRKAQELYVSISSFAVIMETTAQSQATALKEASVRLDEQVRRLEIENSQLKKRRKQIEDDENSLSIYAQNLKKKELVINDRMALLQKEITRIAMVK